MSKSFSDILTASPDTLEPSLPLPAGDYIIEALKADIEALKFDFGDRKEGDECLMVYFKPVEPVEVDEDELSQVEDFRSKLLNKRIFADEMGDVFCDMAGERGLVYHLGMDPADFESTKDMILAIPGKQCMGTVVHAPNKSNPDKPYVNLKQTAPV